MKKLIKNILPQSLTNKLQKRLSQSAESVFTDIYRKKYWQVGESLSGPGSEMHATENIRKAIPKLIDEWKIKTIADVSCGDFHWMRTVDLSGVKYQGFDIVADLIKTNIQKYQTEQISFGHMDIIKDDLVKVDLIFNRECLVHLSFHEIFNVLNNTKRSESKYLLTSTFPDWSENTDIVAGAWRPLNLEIAPFNFPQPLLLIEENYTANKKRESGRKCMGLWKITDLP